MAFTIGLSEVGGRAQLGGDEFPVRLGLVSLVSSGADSATLAAGGAGFVTTVAAGSGVVTPVTAGAGQATRLT